MGSKKLARLFGTEEDKVTCSFFFKIGACRHGDKCTRLHYRPPSSQTVLIPHMYENPPIALALAEGANVPEEQAQEAMKHFQDFYEEVFSELSNFGEIEELIVCDNIGDHLVGNVYIKFVTEDDAEKCLKGISGRYYAGKLIVPEYSPVTDLREARCRQYDEGNCTRGGYCNFMHLKHIPKSLKTQLFKQMYEDHPEFKTRSKKSKSRSDNSISKKKHRKSRSRSKNHKHKRHSKSKSRDHNQRKKEKNQEPNESPQDTHKEMTSAERRAMIAKWNEDDDEENNKKDNQNTSNLQNIKNENFDNNTQLAYGNDIIPNNMIQFNDIKDIPIINNSIPNSENNLNPN